MKVTDTPSPTSKRPTEASSERIRHAEQQRTDARDHTADGHHPARPQGIDQDAGGDLHHHVHIEIRRRQAAQLRGIGMEGLLQISRDRRRGEAMEERQHISQSNDDEGGPTQTNELAGLVGVQHGNGAQKKRIIAGFRHDESCLADTQQLTAQHRKLMAIKATIFKANLQIADMERHYYQDHALTLARHPSETDERTYGAFAGICPARA